MFSLFNEEIGCIKIPFYSNGLIGSKSVLSKNMNIKWQTYQQQWYDIHAVRVQKTSSHIILC